VVAPAKGEAGRDAPGDSALARAAANAAARELTRLRACGPAENLGARGDALAHRVLVDLLCAARPQDAVLSEEAVDDPMRLHSDRVWIIDPLDGTREFGEPGRPDWAVHVALWVRVDAPVSADGGRLAAGAVALPARDLVLGTDVPPAPPAIGVRPLRIAVSRTRPPAFVAELARQLDAELVPLGSAGYKVGAVVTGEVDAYLHAGGQYEWDSAAPVAVALAAGLHASRLDGSALRYNAPDPLLPDLLVCRPQFARPLLAHLTALAATARGTS